MTRPFDKHLDGDELDGLLSLQMTKASDSGQLSEQSLREAQRHVESCQDCSRKLRTHKSVQSEILRMRAPSPSPQTPECIGDAEWLKVAAGLLPDTKARELMKHAAQCGHCGPLLKNAAEALVDETTPSEEAWLASLPSAQPDWQKHMAETLRNSAGAKENDTDDEWARKKNGSWWQLLTTWPSPAFVLTGVAVAIVAGWLGSRMLRPPSADQLLAQAYTERRTLEVRIPGAKYAPMRVERGTGGSNLDKPAALLKAEALIGENLQKNSNDPAWLEARARADLLDGNYDSAIKSLQRALETEPDSPALLTDLGSAYYLRAASADRPIDYGNAVEALGEALAKSPDDPIALYNRALASEPIFLYTQAVDDWQHYLRIDPQGEWADEARKHLAAIQEKVKQHAEKAAEPLLTPTQIAGATASDATLRSKIDERIEDYLAVATTEWLPQAYPTAAQANTSTADARAVLGLIAEIADKRHRDPWLKDLLQQSQSPRFPAAAAALAQALEFSANGDFTSAELQSYRAGALFAADGVSAGAFRSEYERTRSLHLAQDGVGCLRAAATVDKDARYRRYPWLSVQLLLEKGTCSWIVGDLGRARESYLEGLQETAGTNYRAISLRALSHLSGISSEIGDETLAWKQARAGLADNWSGRPVPMQAYNLYFSLHRVAESKNQPNLDVAIWREAAAISDSTFDILLRAAAHSYLGKAATAAKMPVLAIHELSAASKDFASAPPNQVSRIARAEAETRLADVELLTGNGRGALARLMAIQPEVQSASDNLLALLFYRTLGKIQFQGGDTQEAENTVRAAVALAELNLGSLRNNVQRLRWGLEARGAYETLVALKLHSGDPQEALELWEWYRGASLRSGKEPLAVKAAELKENPPNPRPSEVHARLARLTSESVISYAVLPDGISVWFFDNRGIVHHWVPISKDRVTLLALSFHRLCSDSASDLAELRTSARNLYDLLIAPINDRIVADRVLVVEADDVLNSIPFEALIDGDGRYLVERTPIVSSYGLYYSNLLRSAPPLSAAAPTLVVGVSAPSGPDDYSLPPLVEAAAEAKAVASNFQSPMLLVDKDVDSGSLIKYLSSARVFHFAGHAVASPKRVGLLLADTTLSADALQGAKLSHLELAVLSACETANGSDGTPVDPNSLIRSFEGSGVPHVVASRWRLDSSAARLFMQIFYSALLQGNTVPRAMQLSENALRNTAGMNRPYFWAALHDFGRS